MKADRDKWNSRYAASDSVVEAVGEPELESHAELLPRQGLGLELASGRGANALYLASLGLEVVAMDVAIAGLRVSLDSARKHQLPVWPVVADLDQVVLPRARFNLVSVVRYLNRELYGAMQQALTPGGMLFVKTFNRRHLIHKPQFNPAFLLEDGELLRVFSALQTIDYDESGPSSWILARREPQS